MARFRVAANKGTASVRTIVNVRANSASTIYRGKVNDYMVGSPATPADNAFDHELIRSTTAGTAASNTPSPNDPAETAFAGLASDTYTVDPTFGVLLMRVPVNMRATYRWVAAPGDELIWPATASNGICGAIQAASATDFSATMGVDSQ